MGLAATPVATPGPQVVGPGGGSVRAPNDAVVVVVPAGAVTRATTFTFTGQTSLPRDLSSFSPVSGVWDVRAADSAGPVRRFGRAVTISMLYSGPASSVIYYWSGTAWHALATHPGKKKGYIAAETDHLTIYCAFASLADLNPAPPSSSGAPFFLLGIVIILVGLVLAALAVLYPRAQANREQRRRQQVAVEPPRRPAQPRGGPASAPPRRRPPRPPRT